MKRFIEGLDRSQTTLLPDCIDDYVDEDNPVRAVDAFVGMLDLAALDFDIVPEATGRPGYHPATMLKLYVYGYLNQVQSSRKLERECARNLELIWLLGRLKPDFKTIADSVATMAPRSAGSAGSSSRSAATSIFWTPASSRSTAASSKP
jgi:transposase